MNITTKRKESLENGVVFFMNRIFNTILRLNNQYLMNFLQIIADLRSC